VVRRLSGNASHAQKVSGRAEKIIGKTPPSTHPLVTAPKMRRSGRISDVL
jgi:hypothetical protein